MEEERLFARTTDGLALHSSIHPISGLSDEEKMEHSQESNTGTVVGDEEREPDGFRGDGKVKISGGDIR